MHPARYLSATAPIAIALMVRAFAATRQPALTLDEVLFRANEALTAYQKQFSSVVAEEHYSQQVTEPGGRVVQTRVLTSDLLLIQVLEEDIWIGFRDVFDVDGKPVRDRQDRLTRLFLQAPEKAMHQADRIAAESARYNLGSVKRTINAPTMALIFLHPLHQHRSYFARNGEEVVGGVAAWIVDFTEHSRPTVIRAGSGDVFSRGRFWIDPATGRVLRSELTVGDLNTTARSKITVDYRPDAALGLLVPARMEEFYDNPRNKKEDVIRGLATYSDSRRFEVKVDESIREPRGDGH